jgi:hypothetical protein
MKKLINDKQQRHVCCGIIMFPHMVVDAADEFGYEYPSCQKTFRTGDMHDEPTQMNAIPCSYTSSSTHNDSPGSNEEKQMAPYHQSLLANMS